MPTYDYECENCGHTFDAFQAMSDDPLKKCPACGKNSLRRLIGGGLGVIFKGSGFYVTDSKSSSSGTKKSEKAGSETTSAETTTSAPKKSGESGSSTETKSGSGKSEKVAP